MKSTAQFTENAVLDKSAFRYLTQNHIRRGIFTGLEQLVMAIGEYIDGHNQTPKPIIWTAKASDILEKVTRARSTLNK